MHLLLWPGARIVRFTWSVTCDMITYVEPASCTASQRRKLIRSSWSTCAIFLSPHLRICKAQKCFVLRWKSYWWCIAVTLWWTVSWQISTSLFNRLKSHWRASSYSSSHIKCWYVSTNRLVKIPSLTDQARIEIHPFRRCHPSRSQTQQPSNQRQLWLEDLRLWIGSRTRPPDDWLCYHAILSSARDYVDLAEIHSRCGCLERWLYLGRDASRTGSLPWKRSCASIYSDYWDVG